MKRERWFTDKKTQEDVIERFKSIYSERFGYELVEYKDRDSNIKIVCREHNLVFETTPYYFIQGRINCPECVKKKIMEHSKNEFIKKSKMKFGDKYNYDYIENFTKKVKIKCNKHDITFEQFTSDHINGRNGCPICKKEKKKENCYNKRYNSLDKYIEEAKEIHNNRYGYQFVKETYIGWKKKVIIVCPIHGKFEQIFSEHLKGKGCDQCSGTYKLTYEEVIAKAKEIHNNKYEYEITEYENTKSKIIPICPIHGNFEQTANAHLSGAGCHRCNKSNKLSLQDCIDKANKIYNNFYDYSLITEDVFKNASTKVTIICPIHGEFKSSFSNHFNAKCKKCAYEEFFDKMAFKKEDVIKQFQEIHGTKYNYDKVEYKGTDEHVIVTCSEHGDFFITPYKHKCGQGCGKCYENKRNKMIAEINNNRHIELNKTFIDKANKIHNNLYEYYSEEIFSDKKVKIKCKRCNKIFYMYPHNHLMGQGCYRCNKLSKGEQKIEDYLKQHKIKYKPQHWFKDCRGIKRPLPFDFLIFKKDFDLKYIDKNLNDIILVEYQGIQHYEPTTFSSNLDKAEEIFKNIQQTDQIKYEYCINNNIRLIRIPYTSYNDIESILDSELFNDSVTFNISLHNINNKIVEADI